MRLIYCLFIFLFVSNYDGKGQVISVADARALPLGSTVTVSGIATNGSEFGSTRFLQDGTGGIAIFSISVTSVNRGDNFTVTGVTTEYQNLLEIAPVNSWTLNSTGNNLPPPVILTPDQLDESNEALLIRINNVTFSTTGTFTGNTTYNFTSNGEQGEVYIRSGHPLIGEQIPSGSFDLIGVASQFGNSYQVLPRDINDLVSNSLISIITNPFPENITPLSFDVAWKTDVNGNTFLNYGLTPALEMGMLNGPVNTSNPVITVSSLLASTVYYVQVFSVLGSDTSFSAITPFITASNSSGDIKVYFDRAVDNTVANSPGNLAVHIPNAFDDTIKAYIDRAQSTLDIAIYSFTDDNTQLLTQAINDAWNRGVVVRIIVESGNANNGLPTLDPAIPIGYSPSSSPFYYGIMHNKFLVIDADDSDPMIPVVMTGSTNWSDNQLNDDRNNLVFIQDQSLAKVYTIEFEEMWGTDGAIPDTLNQKYGPDKTNNTPHTLNIGGRKVEVYFSPSDNTNNQIMRSINSADDELYFATMVFTRYDLAYAIEDRVVNHGVYGAGIMNDSSGSSSTPFQIIQGAVGSNMLLFDHAGQTGILHHKYLIVDQGNNGSDPLVLTGSHNWSNVADQRNDENTIIIYDENIANQYFQEFRSLFNTNGGALGIDDTFESQLIVFPNPVTDGFYINFNTSGSVNGTLHITDIGGRYVYSKRVKMENGSNLIYIDRNDISSGVYLLKLADEQTIYIRKLIVR